MNKLNIKDLTVSIDDKIILKDFNLEISSGEIHVIMGPNGTGKSTLTKIIMGDKNYNIKKGKIFFNDIDITKEPTDKRAKLGIFLGMQMPTEIQGVTNADFLRTALRNKNKNFKLYNFINELEHNIKKLNMNPEMIHRGINEGFSGGERKKNEILQMNMLKPKIILLDEIDSGLDIDSLKIVGNSVMEYFQSQKPAILLVTHYKKLLKYIKPDYIHIMKDGKIIKSGDSKLVDQIEKEGYKNLNKNSIDIIKENEKNE